MFDFDTCCVKGTIKDLGDKYNMYDGKGFCLAKSKVNQLNDNIQYLNQFFADGYIKVEC